MRYLTLKCPVEGQLQSIQNFAWCKADVIRVEKKNGGGRPTIAWYCRPTGGVIDQLKCRNECIFQ